MLCLTTLCIRAELHPSDIWESRVTLHCSVTHRIRTRPSDKGDCCTTAANRRGVTQHQPRQNWTVLGPFFPSFPGLNSPGTACVCLSASEKYLTMKSSGKNFFPVLAGYKYPCSHRPRCRYLVHLYLHTRSARCKHMD